jgi:transcription antitermination factor NusG
MIDCKFSFMQEVKIISGFYKGYIGKVHDFKQKDSEIEYKVKIPNKELWIKETELKALRSGFLSKFV